MAHLGLSMYTHDPLIISMVEYQKKGGKQKGNTGLDSERGKG